MNPSNNNAGETLLQSTPVLKKLMWHADRWGNDHRNLVKSHQNFFAIEKAEKRMNNTSPYSDHNVTPYYCNPPCTNAYAYANSFDPPLKWRVNDAGEHVTRETIGWCSEETTKKIKDWKPCKNCWETFTQKHSEYV